MPDLCAGPASSRTEEAPPPGGCIAKPTVVVADVHSDSRDIDSTVLRHGGWHVLDARDGAEAVALATLHLPDAVVTELCLPGVHGVDVVRRLKEHPATNHIPVLVVTARSTPAAWRQAVEAGCDRYLTKPCEPRTLLRVLRSELSLAARAALPH